MHRLSRYLSGAGLLASCFIAACGRRDTASAQQRDAGIAVEPPRPALISTPAKAYAVIPVATPGSVSGTVDFSGAIPATVEQGADDPACGRPANSGIAHAGTRIGGVLVWLTDIRSGKALPPTRRFEITNDHCTLDPHVQVMLAGGTLNVTSEDRMLHLNRFINVATGKTVALAPFNDEGEVVPFDRTFNEPAEIEVVCDLHPSSHAWIAVLDHPYYATTTSAGGFSIDGIPSGRYHVRAWHPSLGIADDSVTVVAGQPADLALRLLPQSAERAPLRRTARPVPGAGFSAPQPSPSSDSAAADTAAIDSLTSRSPR